MRGTILITVVLCAASSGCATTQLAFTASRQMGTEPDIYTDQAFGNLIRISNDPTVLPYFTLLQSGVPSTNDTGSMTIGSIMFPAQSVVKQLHNQRGGTLGPIMGQRVVGTNWTISPVNDPDRLNAMRYLYLWILGHPIQDLDEAQKLLQQYLGKNFLLSHVPQGWLNRGGWHDVPDGVLRKMHHLGHYYWITPGMEEHLTKLTVTMLDIATKAPSAKPTQTVVWKINPATGLPTEIDVTRTVDFVRNQVTKIPQAPIAVTQNVPLVVPPGVRHPALETYPVHETIEHTEPDELPPLPNRLENYQSPLISPGLFSQPPH